jgi:hypothetical protein
MWHHKLPNKNYRYGIFLINIRNTYTPRSSINQQFMQIFCSNLGRYEHIHLIRGFHITVSFKN